MIMPEINKVCFGHVLDVLKQWPDNFIHCVVTSPPYWGLRSYGTESQIWCMSDKQKNCIHNFSVVCDSAGDIRYRGKSATVGSNISFGKDYTPNTSNFCVKCDAWRGELGSEPTPELFIEHIVRTFREVRRVLRDDGTAWINFGDSYTGSWESTSKLKPKDLVGIPWMVAFALRADGWYLRQDIIWAKPNPMPESVTDRCTKAHEYIFLMAKSPRYFFDAEAIKETASYNTHERLARVKEGHKSNPDEFKNGIRGRKMAEPGSGIKNNSSFDAAMAEMPDCRNKRDVWSVTTEAYPEAHYATFPQNLIKPCILAGCPEFICKKCGKPRVKIVKGTSTQAFNIRVRDVKEGRIKHTDRHAKPEEVQEYKEGFSHVGSGKSIVGYTDCNCVAGFSAGITFDPFMGSGTTALVARNMNRNYIGIELNPKNGVLIEKRLQQERLPL